ARAATTTAASLRATAAAGSAFDRSDRRSRGSGMGRAARAATKGADEVETLQRVRIRGVRRSAAGRRAGAGAGTRADGARGRAASPDLEARARARGDARWGGG